MSAESGSNVDPQKQENESNQDPKDQFVAKKAYEEVSRDMHKNKAKARDLEAKLNESEAKLKAVEEKTMMEEKRWQELYEKEKEEKKGIVSAREKDLEMYLKSAKKSALKQELGGKVKDIYLNNGAIEEIELNDDGTLSSESVLKVANKFRNDFPEVIPTGDSLDINGNASPTLIDQNKQVDMSKMTKEQRFEYNSNLLKQIKLNNHDTRYKRE